MNAQSKPLVVKMHVVEVTLTRDKAPLIELEPLREQPDDSEGWTDAQWEQWYDEHAPNFSPEGDGFLIFADIDVAPGDVVTLSLTVDEPVEA